jgi:hypothetical protein
VLVVDGADAALIVVDAPLITGGEKCILRHTELEGLVCGVRGDVEWVRM